MAQVVMVTGVSRDAGARCARRLAADPAIGTVIGIDVVPPRAELGRQRRAVALDGEVREHQVRRRGANVDADRPQLDVIGCPGDLVDLVIGNVVQVVEFEVVHFHSGRC